MPSCHDYALTSSAANNGCPQAHNNPPKISAKHHAKSESGHDQYGVGI
jgi:hypothetical protein